MSKRKNDSCSSGCFTYFMAIGLLSALIEAIVEGTINFIKNNYITIIVILVSILLLYLLVAFIKAYKGYGKNTTYNEPVTYTYDEDIDNLINYEVPHKNKNYLMLDEFCRICKKCVEAKYNTVAILANNKLTANICGQDTTIVCVCDKEIIDMDIVTQIYMSNPNNKNIMIISTGFFTEKAHEVAISLKTIELCDRNTLLLMMKKANISERSI